MICFKKRGKGGVRVDITLTREQRQVLGQQMQQSMQLLQMSAQEMEAYLRELAMENPLLEVKPPKAATEPPQRTVFAEFCRTPGGISLEDAELVRPVQNYESLTGSVKEQIAGMRVPELMRRELDWLAGELDERGYLPEDPGDLRAFGASRERYENAVAALQSLEPAGVGARNLGECLCIQLRRLGEKDELPYVLCEKYLERLAKGQLNRIAKELGVTVGRVAEAKKRIASLEPRPSNGFASAEVMPYVLPDVEVLPNGAGGFDVVPAERYMPTYGIDVFYSEMARRESLTEEERAYFQAKLSQARWAISCVSRRRDMLTACVSAIVERQAAFFADGVSSLQPLTMTELSVRLSVHPSTISRAVRSKYLSCRWGVYPLSRFFAQEVGGRGGGTGLDVLEAIKRAISQEDAACPLSDLKLAEKLSRQGLEVSRRTVAKYREAEGIPAAPGRRAR